MTARVCLVCCANGAMAASAAMQSATRRPPPLPPLSSLPPPPPFLQTLTRRERRTYRRALYYVLQCIDKLVCDVRLQGVLHAMFTAGTLPREARAHLRAVGAFCEELYRLLHACVADISVTQLTVLQHAEAVLDARLALDADGVQRELTALACALLPLSLL